MAKKSSPKLITKEQYKAKQQERRSQRAAATAENLDLQQNQIAIPKGTEYEGGFKTSKEALTAYPHAISHDPGFHDEIRDHITQLRDRVKAVSSLDTSSEQGKKIGITEAQKSDVISATPRLNVHLDAALNELSRSFAAHQHGAEGGASAYHTAHTAYLNAHAHLADAHRVLFSTGVDQHLGNLALGGDEKKLLTTEDRENRLKDYDAHVKQSALNKKIQLPRTALSTELPSVAITSPTSAVGNRELRRRNMRSDVPVDSDVEGRARAGRVRARAMTGGEAPTLQGIQRVEAGEPLKPKPSPYAGTGVSGFNAIASAAKLHYEATNPGQKWSESPHSKPVDIGAAAKEHFEQTNEGKKWNPKNTLSYVQTNLPHLLSPENHPTIKYAIKHKIGVMASPETTVATPLRLMGESKMAARAGRIVQGTTEDPTTPKAEEEETNQAQVRISAQEKTAPASSGRARRTDAFLGGQVK